MNELPTCTPICFYCEKNRAIKEKYNEPCCNSCDTEFWSSNRPNDYMSNKEKANRHKVILRTFNDIYAP